MCSSFLHLEKSRIHLDYKLEDPYMFFDLDDRNAIVESINYAFRQCDKTGVANLGN